MAGPPFLPSLESNLISPPLLSPPLRLTGLKHPRAPLCCTAFFIETQAAVPPTPLPVHDSRLPLPFRGPSGLKELSGPCVCREFPEAPFPPSRKCNTTPPPPLQLTYRRENTFPYLSLATALRGAAGKTSAARKRELLAAGAGFVPHCAGAQNNTASLPHKTFAADTPRMRFCSTFAYQHHR